MASINANLFKVWTKKAIPMNLIPGMKDIEINNPEPEVYSTYSSSPAKMRNIVVAAICNLFKIIYGKEGEQSGAIGTISFNTGLGYGIEIVQNGIREAGVLKPINNSTEFDILACTERGMYSFKEGKNNGVLLMALTLYKEMINCSDEEFKKNFVILRDLWKNGKFNKEHSNEICSAFAVISTNIHTRLLKDKIDVNLLTASGNVAQISSLMLKTGNLIPNKQFGDGFQILSDDTTVSVGAKKTVVDFKSKREWTEEEKRLIPEVPEWYIVPKEVDEICSLVTKSTNTFKPKRNFMFRGPSSTGKSSMARAIAAKLNMPYMFITCSSDTESSAFLGEPMYDKNGNIKYVESPFIKAIKNGYVIEVQEPYTIAKQGVLTSLNGLLDDSAGVTLATGEFVKRHPDAVVIFTTNVSYVGCKKPNQSVLRRMNGVYDINMPSEAEVCKRVKANTKFDDEALLRKMVKCAHKIDIHLQEQMIDDGVCGVSEIIDWVSAVQISGNIVEAACSTIVSKATDDALEQANIIAIVEAAFAGTEYAPNDDIVNSVLSA